MKLSYRFIKDFLPNLQISSSQIVEILNKLGFEVTKVTQYNLPLNNCIVGKVMRVQPHPNANKLQVVTVKISSKSDSFLKIVCGATNVRESIFVPIALPGCILPGEIEIKQADIRGISSSGMICSLFELGLQSTEDGIWVIEETVQEGQDIQSVLDSQDVIFDVDILSNRADCLGVWGITRELSVACDTLFLEDFGISFEEPVPNFKNEFEVELQNGICDAFYLDAGKIFQMNTSSQRIQQILKRHEIVPQNIVLDTIALSVILYGHPFQVYDAEKIGRKIKVSQDFSDGIFYGFDGNQYLIDKEDVVISDENGSICLAGTMGGKEYSVTNNTRMLCLESSIFPPVSIRRSAKKKGIQSRSSFLFGQGTTLKQLQLGRRFIMYRLSKDHGVIWFSHFQKCTSDIQKSEAISIDQKAVTQLLGYEVSWSDCLRIWKGIGCEVLQKEETLIIPPPWRKFDLKETCDLVEEILRHTGYDTSNQQYEFPVVRNSFSVYQSMYRSNLVEFVQKFYQTGKSLGYRQVFTSPLGEKTGSCMQVSIDNPMLTHQTHLRDSFFGGMLSCIQHNIDRGKSSIALMEEDSIFYNDAEDIKEKRTFGLCFVARNEVSWNNPEITLGASNFFSHIFTFLWECCGLRSKQLQIVKKNLPVNGIWDKDFQYTISIRDKDIAKFGVVSNEKYLNLYKNLSECIIFYGEFDIGILYGEKRELVPGLIFPFPCIYRDFAVVISKNYWLWPLYSYFQNFHPWIQSVEIKNIYEGESIEDGKISVVFSIAYRDEKKTLARKDVELVEKDLAKQVVMKFEVQLR